MFWAHTCRSMLVEGRDQPVGAGSHLPPCRSADQTQVVGLGGKSLYPLSHLPNPEGSISDRDQLICVCIVS